MAITFTVADTTLMDQLDPTTLDGLPNNNANDNCVGATVAECLHIVTTRTYDGDEVKDAALGAGFVGFESARDYVNYCATQGASLVAHNDTQAGLIATIRAQVALGHPVILTMPSTWNTPPADPMNPGASHVSAAVGLGPDMIRVENVWHGFYQDETDEWWQARLCYGQVWIMTKVGESMSGVPAGWHDDGTTLTAPAAPDGKQYTVVLGEREYILANEQDPTDVPVCEEFGVNEVELGNASLGGGSIQFFLKSGQRSYTTARGVYQTWNGQEMLALHNRINTLAAQLAQAQSAPAPAPVPAPAPLTAAQQADLAAMAAIRAADKLNS